ncbi:MAG: single-stranded-DNA-specific exonuclease RecJ [Congregibacter sp.]
MMRTIRRREPTTSVDLPGIPQVLSRVYASRGVTTVEELNPGLAGLLPPATLKNAEAAAARLHLALERDEPILIVGDFDADGATSTALAVHALRACGCRKVGFLVPNRFEFGYGLTPGIVALALDVSERPPGLIVTVDNGISSIEGVEAANAAGIQVLVTDHHLPGRELPDAEVIVNPNQPGCDFESKALAGVGVMFYVLLALRARLREAGWFAARGLSELNMAAYLDLVALGTVADVVPLDKNNRILVQGGLERIRAARLRPGLAALLEVAGKDITQVAASDLGFAAGPRLNAAGRLDDMSLGINCLLAEQPLEARQLASTLDSMNRERQLIERGMQEEAMAILARATLSADNRPPAYVLYEKGWHQGVVGIVASRIKDRFHRPVIAFADVDNEELKGSGRSIPGLHLRDVLDSVATQNPGLITRFGGHAMAAGLSLPVAALETFSEAFTAAVEVTGASEAQAVLDTDGELAAEDFSLDLAHQIRFGGPWGQHFPEPVFEGVFELVSQRIVGERHLKLTVREPGTRQVLDAIAFGVDLQRWPNEQAFRAQLAYKLDINQFRGQTKLQLLVEQILAL